VRKDLFLVNNRVKSSEDLGVKIMLLMVELKRGERGGGCINYVRRNRRTLI